MNKIKWRNVFLMFVLCTLLSITFISVHMKVEGELINSPSTVSGMFFTLLILGVPQHLIELVLIYIVYYLIIRNTCVYMNRISAIAFMLLFGFVYFYLIQAFLGGMIGNVDEYSFIGSFKKINYFYFYVTVIYMVQINISFLITHKNSSLSISDKSKELNKNSQI